MATYGVLGQASPSAGNLATVYTVPPGAHATLRVIACNRAGACVIRVSVASAGAADAVTQYVLYDFPLPTAASNSTAPITVGATDEVRCLSSTGSVSFTVTGIEADD